MEIKYNVAVPGQVLGGQNKSIVGGKGTYVDEDNILRASIFGRIISHHGKSIISVAASSKDKEKDQIDIERLASDIIIRIGSDITGRITRINLNQAIVDIYTVNGVSLLQTCRGVVRREDIRGKDLDSLIMYECFVPGDWLKAKVISLGDSKQYFLSTTKENYGVFERGKL
jgi:exosome complex component CSL4